jgi:hypothetical protein
MARTDATQVQAILLDNYDSANSPSLTAFINAASRIVDRIVACATTKGLSHTSDELIDIETWLAAHLYAQSDQTYASKSTSGASASFHGQTGMALDSTKFGQTAKLLDHTGCINSVGKSIPRLDWLGLAPSEQTDYVDRD